MYIFTSDRKSIVDTHFVERLCRVDKPDAFLIIASYSADRAVTIGKYAGRSEADSVLAKIFNALSIDDSSFLMPDSPLFGAGDHIHDARAKRKGGS